MSKFLTFIVVNGVSPSLELLSSSSMVLETTFEQVSSCFEAAAAAETGSSPLQDPCKADSEDLDSQPGLINGKYGLVVGAVWNAAAADTAAAAAAEECKSVA